MSYPLCVFLESREQMLPIHHPFYRIVEETLENVIQSSLVLHCMAKHTLVNESHTESPNDAAENQMVQQITRYLRNNFPTVSGSNSPAMDSVIVDVRSYSGCGKDPKSRKFTRKHVYIQKHLVDALMKAEARSKSDDKGACPSLEGHFYLLKFLVKLCLLRGLITVVKFAFMSENIDAKDPTRGSLCLTRNLKFQTLFERFLFEWDGWFIFTENHRIGSKRSRYGRHRLWAIVLADRVFQFCYVSISSDMHPSESREVLENACALPQLAAGDWTALPPVTHTPFNVFHDCCLRIWNFPPTGDPKPRRVEITPWNFHKGLFSFTTWFNRAQDPVEE